MLKGHLHLLHADLSDVPYDAVVLPTDSTFSVRDHWKTVGDASRRPPGFDDRHFGRAGEVWWLDVTRDGGVGSAAMLEDLTACLADIAASSTKRPTRVALPVPGTDGGGLDDVSGEAHADLLAVLARLAEHHQLDILLTVKDDRRFQSLQEARLGDPTRWFPGFSATGRPDEPTLKLAEILGTRARRGELSLLLGAGASVGAGLPDWPQLVAAIVRQAHLPDTITPERFQALGLLDQAELLQRQDPKFAATIIEQVSTATKPGLTHLLLAALRVQQSVTTNYDDLYERAVCSADPTRPLAVLPYARPTGGRPWLLKMHGDIAHPDDIVLTRSQFAAYDARHRPAGALFQSMLLTSHLLVVGPSLTDDNVLRLVHQVRDYLRPVGAGGDFGTVLTLSHDPTRSLLWKGELDWVSVDRDGDDPARVLEIFLDAVVMYAHAESTSVLDERFDAQLGTDKERDLARRVRAVASEVEKQTGQAWQGIKGALRL